MTDETIQGALQVNKERQDNGLNLIDVHVVPMVPADDYNQDGDKKLSSTSLRREMLGILLKPPLVIANIFSCQITSSNSFFYNYRNLLNLINPISLVSLVV